MKQEKDKIDKQFEKISEKNKEFLEASKLKPINNKFLYAQNGIHLMIAGMGSGKTYNYMKICVRSEQKENFYDQIVICSTSKGFDQTVESFKPLIKKTKLIHIGEEELLPFLYKHMKRVKKFNSIYRLVGSNFKQVDEEFERIINKYALKNPASGEMNVRERKRILNYISNKMKSYSWRLKFPYRTLLILDDFANTNSLKNNKTELSKILKKLRHYFINVIICIQSQTGVPKDIRRNITDISLFKGMSEEDFKTLYKTTPINIFDYDNLFSLYKSLVPHQMMTMHIIPEKIILTNPD
jgi:hypothetical protein